MKNISPGIHLGKITDNCDPDELGRVKVSIEVLGETIITDWIPQINMSAAPDVGSYFLPEIDAVVAVSFIQGAIYNPIVLGGIWADFQKPPASEENSGSDFNADGENNLKFIRTRSGQRIIFDDKDGEEKIQILSKDAGTRFEFLTSEEMINIETDKNINIVSGGKLAIEAEEAEITIEATLGITSKGLSIEADDAINITSGSGIAVEGNSVKLN